MVWVLAPLTTRNRDGEAEKLPQVAHSTAMTLKALLYQDGQKGAAPIITESLNWKEWTAGYSTYTDKRDLHMQDNEFGCESWKEG